MHELFLMYVNSSKNIARSWLFYTLGKDCALCLTCLKIFYCAVGFTAKLSPCTHPSYPVKSLAFLLTIAHFSWQRSSFWRNLQNVIFQSTLCNASGAQNRILFACCFGSFFCILGLGKCQLCPYQLFLLLKRLFVLIMRQNQLKTFRCCIWITPSWKATACT